MSCAINFDDELFGAAYEVGNVGADGFLSCEFEGVELAVAQILPEDFFGSGGLASHRSGVFEGSWIFTYETKSKAPHPPIARAMGPIPLPDGGRDKSSLCFAAAVFPVLEFSEVQHFCVTHFFQRLARQCGPATGGAIGDQGFFWGDFFHVSR